MTWTKEDRKRWEAEHPDKLREYERRKAARLRERLGPEGMRALWRAKQAGRRNVMTSAHWAARTANVAAVKYGAPGRLVVADIRALWDRQPACVSCGNGRGVDHIKALALGGTNTPDNLQNLCPPCNRTKWHTERKAVA